MIGSASLPIALGFVLGIIPFALWTCWMLREDRKIRETELLVSPPGRARRVPVSEPRRQFHAVRGIRARWRREQMAA
jgi:hypothetical protein